MNNILNFLRDMFGHWQVCFQAMIEESAKASVLGGILTITVVSIICAATLIAMMVCAKKLKESESDYYEIVMVTGAVILGLAILIGPCAAFDHFYNSVRPTMVVLEEISNLTQ